MAEVVLGVSGGIAAYKSAELLRLFTESGHSVRVVPTASSLKFVGAATWEALSGKPAQTEVFEHVDEVAHVRIGQGADLVVVAPATANTLAKAARAAAYRRRPVDQHAAHGALSRDVRDRDAHRDVGEPRPHRPTSPRCERGVTSSSSQPSGA